MNEKWIEDLREGLSDFEMDAPEGLWESLGVETPVPKSDTLSGTMLFIGAITNF